MKEINPSVQIPVLIKKEPDIVNKSAINPVNTIPIPIPKSRAVKSVELATPLL